MIDSPRPVTVLGAGLMGHALAFVFACGGWRVTLFDRSTDVLAHAPTRIRERAAEVSVDAPEVTICADLETAVRDSSFVIEAVAEDVEVKGALLRRAMAVAPNAIFASNTSVIPVGEIARRLPATDRFLVTHWWNPPHLIDIVEVVTAGGTDDGVLELVFAWLTALGKTPVHVRHDVPGFIGNRMQFALWREAMHIVAEGIADAATVDLVARETFGRRLATIGPLANADYIGLPLTRAIMDMVLPDLSVTPKAPAVVRQLLDHGATGAASGCGFLEWPTGRASEVGDALSAALIAQRKDA